VRAEVSPQICRVLANGLRSESEGGRQDAATALIELGPEAMCAFDALRAATKDPDVIVRERAVRALGKIGPPAIDAVDDLFTMPLISGFDSHELFDAVTSFGPAVIPRVVPYLEVRYEDGEDVILTMGAAAEILGRFGEKAVPSLVEALRNPRRRSGAAVALSKIGRVGAAAVPTLIEVFDAPENTEWEWEAIIEALAVMADSACDARPLLERIARQRQAGSPPRHIKAAEAALKRIPACPMPLVRADVICRVLANELRSRSEGARQDAALALIELGPEAICAFDALRAAMKDRNVIVRERALRVLGKIGPPAVSVCWLARSFPTCFSRSFAMSAGRDL
jgi:HEAT repeat protein